MKTIAITLTLILLILNGLALVPALQPYGTYLVGGSAVLALALLLFLASKGGAGAPPESATRTPAAEPAKPAAPPAAPARAEAEIIGLLAAFQEKGRLVDFLMDDITAFGDAQVGAAARVVHQGCRAVLDDHFEIKPLQETSEGTSVTVPAKHAADEYRLTGRISGEPPFSGTLVHKGWKTGSVKIPRLIDTGEDDRLPAIAPAEVEVG